MLAPSGKLLAIPVLERCTTPYDYVDGVVIAVGFDKTIIGDPQFRVETRDASDGSLRCYKIYNPTKRYDYLVDCTVLDGYVYILGVTSGIKPDEPKALILKASPSLDISEVIESSGGHIYIGGQEDGVFRVDRSNSSLSRIATYKSPGLSGYSLTVFSMAFNKVTGHL